MTKQELESEIEQLKANQAKLIERIQTLEAIVTDDGYQLNRDSAPVFWIKSCD